MSALTVPAAAAVMAVAADDVRRNALLEILSGMVTHQIVEVGPVGPWRKRVERDCCARSTQQEVQLEPGSQPHSDHVGDVKGWESENRTAVQPLRSAHMPARP